MIHCIAKISQGVIESGGTRPNIITASAGLVYYIRSATLKEADALKARAIKCFEGAAMATGCTVEFEEYVSLPVTLLWRLRSSFPGSLLFSTGEIMYV
jgi:metal-dependent amidase/aminoacylase/carboxypeptidase family protein